MTDKLRDCAVCGAPVPVRPNQADSARACSPGCAKTLAVRENPDLQPNTKTTFWKQRIDDINRNAEEGDLHEDQEEPR